MSIRVDIYFIIKAPWFSCKVFSIYLSITDTISQLVFMYNNTDCTMYSYHNKIIEQNKKLIVSPEKSKRFLWIRFLGGFFCKYL